MKISQELEKIDFLQKLNSYKSVGHAVDQAGFWSIDKKYHNADFYIIMMSKSSESYIKKFLNKWGLTAWLEYDDKMVKIGS